MVKISGVANWLSSYSLVGSSSVPETYSIGFQGGIEPSLGVTCYIGNEMGRDGSQSTGVAN